MSSGWLAAALVLGLMMGSSPTQAEESPAPFSVIAIPGCPQPKDIAASGMSWLVACRSVDNTHMLVATRDGGRTWQRPATPSIAGAPPGMNPHVLASGAGSFAALRAAADQNTFTVEVIDAQTLAVREVAISAPAHSSTVAPTRPVIAADGSVWLGWTDTAGRGHLTRTASSTEEVATYPADMVADRQLFSGGQEHVYFAFFEGVSNPPLAPQGGTLVERNDLVLLERGPITVGVGSALVSGPGGYAMNAAVWPIGRDLLQLSDQEVLYQSDPDRFVTGLDLPDNIGPLAAAENGVIGLWRASLVAFNGAIPQPVRSDPLGATAREMLDTLNAQQRAAGFPPVRGDALMAQAAANHSRYWTLNRFTGSDYLLYHRETPGLPGFTGVTPQERCAFVGTVCYGEVMYTGRVDGRAAVKWWNATLYHRLVSPIAGKAVGGAITGSGPAVLNEHGFSTVIGAPTAYPLGQYDGPLSFSGEAPDPTRTSECRGKIHWPLGTAITVYSWGDPQPVSVSLAQQGGHPVRGCMTQGGSFLPDHPLLPDTTYVIRADWGANGSRTWTFSTSAASTPRDDERPPTKRRINLKATSVRRHSRLKVVVRPRSAIHAYRVRVQRLTRRHWRIVRRARTTGPAERAVVDMRAGRYRVLVPAQFGLAGATSHIIRLKR